MQHMSSNFKKSLFQVGFQPILFPGFVLILALMAMPPRSAGQASNLEQTGGEISGTVFSGSDNQPATQVAVSLQSRGLGIFRSVLTDFAGHFEVRSLPPGAYEIKVEEQGFETTSTNAQVDANPVKLVLRLKPSIVSTGGQKSNLISVRELKISDKAKNEYNKGLEGLWKKDWPESLSHFAKAIKAFPDYYEAYYHIGLVQTNLRQLDEADGAFQKAVELSNGRYARADFGIGYVLYLRGKNSEAEQVIRRGLEVDDREPDGHVILGMALLRLDRLDEAEKCGREALLRDPNFAKAYLVLADAFGRKHKFEEQLQSLDSYLRLEPNGPLSERSRQAREAVARIIANSQPHE
jgi:tetratricopeptide (TPR) repeat protein